MRDNLKGVNRFFRSVVDKVPCPRVYIPELPDHPMTISVRKIIMLKGRGSGPVVRLQQIIRSPKWHQAWLKLEPQPYGWFLITGIHWKHA